MTREAPRLYYLGEATLLYRKYQCTSYLVSLVLGTRIKPYIFI